MGDYSDCAYEDAAKHQDRAGDQRLNVARTLTGGKQIEKPPPERQPRRQKGKREAAAQQNGPVYHVDGHDGGGTPKDVIQIAAEQPARSLWGVDLNWDTDNSKVAESGLEGG